MGKSELKWHFIDYPTDSEELVLVKTTDNELVLACWDDKKHVWLDAGRDWDWFGTGCVSCWAEVCNIPDTTRPMPKYNDVVDKIHRPYPDRSI